MPRTNFRSPYTRRLHIKFGFVWPSGFWRRRSLSIVDDDGRTPDHEYPISSPMSLRLRLAKNGYQIWPYCKICQGHSRIIIWTHYDGQESPMLHTKFRENRPAGSGEEDFWRFFFLHFTIYGRGRHLGHVNHMPRTNFCSPYTRRLHIKFGFDWPSRFWRRRSLSIVDDDDDDGRTPYHEYPISSPMSLRLRWTNNGPLRLYNTVWCTLVFEFDSFVTFLLMRKHVF